MLALSVKQPFASEISRGVKRREYRTWKTGHRGDLLIVASRAPVIEGLPAGAAVCVVELVNVTGHDGAYVWHLRNPRPVAPVAVRGYAALYRVADDLIRIVASPPPAGEGSARRAARPRHVTEDGERIAVPAVLGGRATAPRVSRLADCPPCFVDGSGREVAPELRDAAPWD